MITQKELDVIKYISAIASSVGIIQAQWDSKQKCLQQSNSNWPKFKSYLVLCLCIILTFHGNLRLIHIFMVKSQAFDPFFQFIYIFQSIAYLSSFLLKLVFVLPGQSLIILFNQLLFHVQKQGLANETTKRGKYFVLIFKLSLNSSISAAIFIATVEAHYCHAAKYNHCIALVTTSIVHTFCMCLIYLFLFIYAYLYYVIVKSTLQLNVDELEMQQTLLRYKTLQILSNIFNNGFYCRIVLPIIKYETMLMSMVFVLIGKNLRATHHHYSTAISIGFISSACFLYIFIIVSANMICSFWTTSVKYIWGLKHEIYPATQFQDINMKLYIHRVLGCMSPLRFNVGNAYYMEKTAKLTLASLLVYGTSKLLIAFKA